MNILPREDEDEFPHHREDEPEPIYIMTVELEEGKSQSIKIYSNSTPSELAFEFCKQNNLDINAMNYLSEQIKMLLEELNNNQRYTEKDGIQEENECIQEVDEEDYQTETRKTHKSNNNNSQTPNSPMNPGSQYDNDSEISNNYKHVYTKNFQNFGTSNNTMPEVLNREQLSRISSFEQAPLTKFNSAEQKESQSEVNNTEEENIVRSKGGVPIMNHLPEGAISGNPPARDTKNLEDVDIAEMEQTEEIDGTLGNLNLSKNKNQQEDVSRNSQRLFSYQVFYDNFKKSTSEKNVGLDRESRESKGVRIEKNGSISNSQIGPSNNKSKQFPTSNKPDNIFEKLFRNSDVKRYGMNMKPRYDSNLPRDLTNSSYLSRKENLLNLSQDMTSTIKSKNTRYRNGEVINYGERLYQKGLKLKEETMKKIENIKRERDNSNSNIYTFKPVINEAPRELMRKRSENILSIHNEDRILRYNNYLEEKFEKLKSKHQRSDPNYSFVPIINKNSAKIADEKFQAKVLARVSSSASPDFHRLRIEDLYELAKVKEFRIQELGKQIYSAYNYQPYTNHMKSTNGNPLLSLNFNQRLDAFRQKSQERKKQLTENFHSPVDPKTGQNLFVPKLMSKSRERINYAVNNESEGNSRYHTSNIFNNLYSYAQKFSKNKYERQKELQTSIKKASGSIHTTNDSEIILMKKKEEIFKKIFRILDSDQDNQISSVNIDLKRIPTNISSILNPIISELKEENETLNENEFVRACEHLYEVRRTI